MSFQIILEGVDNSGKTTLASKLRVPVPDAPCPMTPEYFHPGGPPQDELAEAHCLQEQFDLLIGSREQARGRIHDRCTAISQEVYNPNPTMAEGRRAWLQEVLGAGIVLVYCRPSTDWLMSFEHFTWRDGETEEHKQKILEKQHVFINRYDSLVHGLPHVAYDYQDTHSNMLVEYLRRALCGDLGAEKFIRNLTPYQFRSKYAGHSGKL